MPFSHALVGKSDGPGEPGLILQPGPMTFAVYTAGLFPAGSYRIGLACTQFRETAAFWDTEIVIADAPEVEPGRFTWSVVDTPSVSAAAQRDSNWSGAWIVALVGLVLLGGAVGVSRNRRSTHSHMTPKEQS
jgi:hypothetical protein